MARDKQEMEVYNTEVYAYKWLNTAEERLSSDYYRKDHYMESLASLAKSGGTRALECGIGTGEFFAIELARAGKEIFGIDFSKVLLEDCARRFEAEGYEARLSMADVGKMPFKDGVFDITYAIGVMPLVPDLYETVAEMARVTKRGGVVLFDVMNPWHVSQSINHLYKIAESTRVGFGVINLLKKIKERLGFRTNFKPAPEKVNHRLISPLALIGVLKKFPWRYGIKGYNVLLPINMPILGARANLCDRSPLFSRGLKDNRILKYFGSKMVVMVEKIER